MQESSKNGKDKIELPASYVSTPHYVLFEPGDIFQNYRIIKELNKDTEGLKYIAEKDGHQYLLKIFYKSSLHDVQSIFGLQMRLQHLNDLKDKHTAKVVEIDPHHDPAYMVAEYIHGVSLAHIKQHNPERLTEDFIRHIAPQLVKSAIAIHKHQLTLSKIALTNIMVDDSDSAIILSSAITYEDRDEREELFAIAAVIAQALSQHAMYKSIYSYERLISQKFAFIAGVSLSLNKVLAECLHRNILQRYMGLPDFLTALVNLPPIAENEIWSVIEKNSNLEDLGTADKPKTRIEFGFWLLVIIIVGLVGALLTTNIFSVLFAGKGDTLKYVGIDITGADEDSLKQSVPESDTGKSSPVRTSYGDLKYRSTTDKPDFRKQVIPSPNNTSSAVSSSPKAKSPANMVFIDAGTLGFGRLKDNLHHNVSLSQFYISYYEVTQEEWSRFMKPANSSTFGDKLPVDNVSWFDIAIYCNGRSEAEGLTPAYKIRGVGAARVVTCNFKANGYRLPTEAEWEMAAKAGKLYNYSGSEDADEVSWNRDNSGGKIHRPGGKNANDFGIYDMTGNVSEWVWDWYDANYIRSLPTFINPIGPETGTQKTIRGGNVNNGEGRNLNVMWREKGDPNRGYQYVGFRLVRSN